MFQCLSFYLPFASFPDQKLDNTVAQSRGATLLFAKKKENGKPGCAKKERPDRLRRYFRSKYPRLLEKQLLTFRNDPSRISITFGRRKNVQHSRALSRFFQRSFDNFLYLRLPDSIQFAAVNSLLFFYIIYQSGSLFAK